MTTADTTAARAIDSSDQARHAISRGRRLAAAGVAIAALWVMLVGAATPASAAIAPVQYASGSSGHIQCYTTTFGDGTHYSYLDVAPPTRVVDYRGTYSVRWIAQVFKWVNGQWVRTGVQDGAVARGAVNTAGWLQIGYWTGPEGVGALELNATAGAYFTVVETTAWYNSAGKMITSNVNGSNVAAC